MVARRWLPVALLVLASMACAVQGPNTDATQPTASQDVQGAFFTVQSSPVATISIPVENTPNTAATQQAKTAAELAAAQAKTADLQAQLADQKAQAVGIRLSIAEAERETAKYNAMTTQNGIDKLKADAALLAEKNRTLELQNEAARLETERLKAQADAESAKTQQLLLLFVGAISVSGFLLMARVIRKRDPVVVEDEQEPDPFPELDKLGRQLPASAESMYAEPDPPGETLAFSHYAEYALHGWALGINAVENAKLYTRDAYAPVYAWMARKNYLVSTANKVGLSSHDGGGVEFCEDWLKRNPLPIQ